MAYFFVAVSTKENLQLCKKYLIAGFPNTINGLWAFLDIDIGDFITFLYGARAHNLYTVSKKEAIKNAWKLPPWKLLTFRSGKKVDFPFRLFLKQVREIEELIAKTEFSYIAENLLLRGGYRKTHFQADQTTLQNVSQMGKYSTGKMEILKMPSYKTFIPKFIRKKNTNPPIYQFREIILQSLIRKYLSKKQNLRNFLKEINLEKYIDIEFEVLGEKAFPEGHVDILIKEMNPEGIVKQIIIEIKLNKATPNDEIQLKKYLKEVGRECLRGVLIAKQFPKNIKPDDKIYFCRYEFKNINLEEKAYTFHELLSSLSLHCL